MFNSAEEIRLIRMFNKPGGTCALCDHSPITYHFVLRNQQTGASIIVGSRCVNNIKEVLKKNGSGVNITCSSKLSEAAGKLNGRFPGLVIVEKEFDEDASYSEPDPDESEDTDLTFEDCSPEGMGYDEVDWDSWDGE